MKKVVETFQTSIEIEGEIKEFWGFKKPLSEDINLKKCTQFREHFKGQLISKGHFGVFKSTKKTTKFL